MIKNKQKQAQEPVKIAIFGMDPRLQKMLVMFLSGPCKGAASIVDDINADADLIDLDAVNSKHLLEQRQKLNPERPIIIISLNEIAMEGVVFLKKPIKALAMVDVISQVRKTLNDQLRVEDQQKKTQSLKAVTSEKIVPDNSPEMIVRHAPADRPIAESEKKKNLNFEERKKTSKHKTAMLLDEKSFSAYIGLLTGVDFNDPSQLVNAKYNTAEYFQGYIQKAYNLAHTQGRVLSLNTAWKPVSIFPHSREIWIDSNDTQLRSFSAVPIATFSDDQGASISISPITAKNKPEKIDLEKFQTMEAFLWKVAIWTSKGRYPQGIDLDQPIFLKQWPNFTRLVVTPHALRITALLIEGPRTLTNIAETLNIKYQYVFIYFSAVYALGIAGQAIRKADVLIAPAEVKVAKKTGLLSRIMSKLRGAK